MLSWFKKKPELSPAVQYARAVSYQLDWWLLCLMDDGHTYLQNERMLEAALGLHGEGRSIRNATAYLANLLVGDLILGHPAGVREEVLAHMGEPAVLDALLHMKSSEVVTVLDLFDGPGMETLIMGPHVRPQLRKNVLEKTDAPSLSAQAKLLFAGVRHLWERAIVAVQAEKADEDLRRMTGRLIAEGRYALEGADVDARHARHVANLIEDAIGHADTDAEPEE